MDRVNGANTIDIGDGRRGFRDRNALAGLAGTEVTADWLNAIQEELLAVVIAAGIEPSENDLQQVLEAIQFIVQAAIPDVPSIPDFATLAEVKAATVADEIAAPNVIAKAIQAGAWTYAEAAGTANALTADLRPVPAALADLVGSLVVVKIATPNTAVDPTIKFNALPAATIKRAGGGQIQPGELAPGLAILSFDGANFQLMAVSAAAVQSGASNYAVDSGAANAIVVALTPAPAGYSAGLVIRAKIAANGTGGATTLNMNGKGARSVKMPDGSNPPRGALVAGMVAVFVDDGTSLYLTNPATSASLAANGYQTLPSGLILQWATGPTEAAANSESPQTITFPTPFPTECLTVFVSTQIPTASGNSDYWYQTVGTPTVSTCVVIRQHSPTADTQTTTTSKIFALGR
jgi:hypothetical protein